MCEENVYQNVAAATAKMLTSDGSGKDNAQKAQHDLTTQRIEILSQMNRHADVSLLLLLLWLLLLLLLLLFIFSNVNVTGLEYPYARIG